MELQQSSVRPLGSLFVFAHLNCSRLKLTLQFCLIDWSVHVCCTIQIYIHLLARRLNSSQVQSFVRVDWPHRWPSIDRSTVGPCSVTVLCCPGRMANLQLVPELIVERDNQKWFKLDSSVHNRT